MSFKICMIGCGEHSFNYHGPSCKKYARLNDDVILAACCDIDEAKAAYYQKTFGFINRYSDYSKMLQKEEPDAVCLVVPVECTAEIAYNILDMGYPLILEKPPGRTPDEAKKLTEIARRKNIPNRVALNRRYMPLVFKMKELLPENTTPEDLFFIDCCMLREKRTDPDFSTTAIHAIDLVKYIAGADYRSVSFNYRELGFIGEGVVNTYMNCTFTSGAAGQIRICPVAGTNIERFIVSFRDNTILLNLPLWSKLDTDGRITHLRDNQILLDKSGHEISGSDEDNINIGVYYENASFFDDIRAGRKPEGGIDTAIQSVEIANCIRNRASSYENKLN